MTTSVPKSNIDLVAFNIANQAVVDEFNRPGEALADLFSRMSHLAHEIAGINRTAQSDWNELLSTEPDVADIHGTVARQVLAIGDAWATQWALAHIAKHLSGELERVCLEHSASEQIRSIEYDDNANVISWTQNPLRKSE